MVVLLQAGWRHRGRAKWFFESFTATGTRRSLTGRVHVLSEADNSHAYDVQKQHALLPSGNCISSLIFAVFRGVPDDITSSVSAPSMEGRHVCTSSCISRARCAGLCSANHRNATRHGDRRFRRVRARESPSRLSVWRPTSPVKRSSDEQRRLLPSESPAWQLPGHR